MKLRQKLLTGTLVFVSILMCGCSKDVQKQQKTAETDEQTYFDLEYVFAKYERIK